jgi:tetratricopeptide (TPR) repeat protein
MASSQLPSPLLTVNYDSRPILSSNQDHHDMDVDGQVLAYSQQAMRSMASVIEHNNSGVNYFEGGDYSAAFRCFRESLVLFKARFQDQQQEEQLTCHPRGACSSSRASSCHAYSTESRSSIQPLSCSEACMALVRHRPPFCSTTQEYYMQDSCSTAPGFVLHTQCIRLLPNFPGVLSSDPSLGDRLVSAILVFNCGLVFHVQGQKKGSLHHIHKALTLYQQAVALLQDPVGDSISFVHPSETSSRGKVTGNALLDLLHMAILNNMGLILRCDLLDHAKSRLLFGQLVACAHAFQKAYAFSPLTNENKAQQQEQSCMYNMFEQVDEFLLNAVAFNCADPPGAPAA